MESISLDVIREMPVISRNLLDVYADCCVILLEQRRHQSGTTKIKFCTIIQPKIRKKQVEEMEYILAWNSNVDTRGFEETKSTTENAGYGMVLLYLLTKYPNIPWGSVATARTETNTGVDFELHFPPPTDFIADEYAFLQNSESSSAVVWGIEVKATGQRKYLMRAVIDAINQIKDAKVKLEGVTYLIIATDFETPSINQMFIED